MTILQAIQVLELELPLTPDSVKKAYREQAKLWHPDNFMLYEQQIEAGRRFISIKEAYDTLRNIDQRDITHYIVDNDVVKRNRANEAPAYNNDLKLFNTPLFKETENIFSLFYLLSKWQWFGVPAVFAKAYTTVNNYIKPHRAGFGPQLARVLLFIVIIVFISVFTVVSIPVLVFAALLFVPLMYLYVKTIKGLTYIFKNALGYLPAPNCGHIGGELVYLGIRSFLPLALLVTGIIYMPVFTVSLTRLLLLSGYILFAVFINISVLYEWVSFIRVQYLRTKFSYSN